MEFPTEEWDIFEANDFETAPSRTASDLSVEVMAQIRPNGRIMDHWRVATGGTSILEASMDIRTIIPAAANLPKCTLKFQCWPADLGIRRNMTTSPWQDVMTLLAANELTAEDEGGQAVECRDVVVNLQALPVRSVISAVLRWAICVSKDGKLEVQLQCLPAAVNTLSSKPIYKRYNYRKLQHITF